MIQLKGDDCVLVCSFSKLGNNVWHMYNNGYGSPTYLHKTNPSIGISDALLTIYDGAVNCTFKRIMSMNNLTNYFDITNSYYLLFAKGPTKNGKI
jgi:hypothetical protein